MMPEVVKPKSRNTGSLAHPRPSTSNCVSGSAKNQLGIFSLHHADENAERLVGERDVPLASVLRFLKSDDALIEIDVRPRQPAKFALPNGTACSEPNDLSDLDLGVRMPLGLLGLDEQPGAFLISHQTITSRRLLESYAAHDRVDEVIHLPFLDRVRKQVTDKCEVEID